MRFILKTICAFILLSGCSKEEEVGFSKHLGDTPSIEGKKEYLSSPYVTAGDRLYMVGHQDGSFPEMGWHIQGEMGGIWDHPIKLMDGFDIELIWEDDVHTLDNAHTFTNYPFANRHDYKIDNKSLEIERWQFVPDHKEGIVIQLVIHNHSAVKEDFIIRFTGHADLRPTWLGERTRMLDYRDDASWNYNIDSWMVKDSFNNWFVMYGGYAVSSSHQSVDQKYLGNGVSNAIDYEVSMEGHSSKAINFIIAGSYVSEEKLKENFFDIRSNIEADLNAKKARYQELAQQSKLTIPDKALEQTFEWLKYNSDWLVRTVPEIGSGIAAGIPDYPWWFGVDSEYALKGYMAIGQEEVVYNTIALLDGISDKINGNGRIVHEVSTNGAVFNPGNINETPQFASLIWEIYQWNGDENFLRKYYPTVRAGLDWLMKENDQDGNLFPDGFGMMEIHGMDSEMIDVAAYTQRAFVDAAKMAERMDDPSSSEEYKQVANQLKQKINEVFWSDKFGSFADFIGTDEQALKLIEDAIIRADTLNKPWAVKELKETRKFIINNPSSEPRPFVMHHNWVVNTPMEMNIADHEKALRALETAEAYVNPFGVFVTGIDRDESAGSDDGSFKGSEIFSYTGAVMTLPTGVQAIAENNYGRPDKALNYLKRMTRSFSYALPGSMYEVSPDYGMIVQAWNIYAFAIPIVQQFFGIKPQAYAKRIIIQPQMPSTWDMASLENVAIAENVIDVQYSKSGEKVSLRVEQLDLGWEIKVILPATEDGRSFKILNSSTEPVMDQEHMVFTSKEKVIEIQIAQVEDK